MKTSSNGGNATHLAQLLSEADIHEAEKKSMMAAFLRSQQRDAKVQPGKNHDAIAKRRAKNRAAKRARKANR